MGSTFMFEEPIFFFKFRTFFSLMSICKMRVGYTYNPFQLTDDYNLFAWSSQYTLEIPCNHCTIVVRMVCGHLKTQIIGPNIVLEKLYCFSRVVKQKLQNMDKSVSKHLHFGSDHCFFCIRILKFSGLKIQGEYEYRPACMFGKFYLYRFIVYLTRIFLF